MAIKMLTTAAGADDGFTVRMYLEGEVYPQANFPCGADLAAAFISAGQAVDLDAVPPAAEQEAAEAVPAEVPAADVAPAPKAKTGRRKA